ncbi:MAG TPA: L,D-transpeptidase family protein [Candidatus Methylomirabilis sp.]|nr:L,D-transpeptidase family protein [Candidatus Methylomirabilis sp.]
MKRGLGRVLRMTVPIGAWILAAQPVFAGYSQSVPTKPEHARPPAVMLWGTDFHKRATFVAFEKTFQNGGELAAGDVDGDGKAEIVVGAGPGRESDVRVYRIDGTLLKSFRAYPAWFKGGVRVAVGDTDGDGKAEIVTAPGPGIEPQVNVFQADGSKVLTGGVPAYQKEFQGGVHLAMADLDRDGKAEIVTSPGPGGGPHVRIWNGRMENMGWDFFAFDASMRDGVSLAVIRTLTGPQLVLAAESWSEPLVRRYAANPGVQLVKEFYTHATSSRSGVRLAAFDFDGDGIDEIIASTNGGVLPEARIFDVYGTLYDRKLLVDPGYRGAFSAAQLDTDGDGRPELATLMAAPTVNGPLDKDKFIEVDMLRQRLYAYERGRTARTFLVSTGTAKYPTPVMETVVLKKVFLKDYRWTYGLNNPDNYFLPNVKWNLQIRGPYNIHYAYWHRNFGHRMSHGCVNVSKADAEWIYNWADVGTPVITHNGTLAAGASSLSKALTKAP